jgi:hypothetical protein
VLDPPLVPEPPADPDPVVPVPLPVVGEVLDPEVDPDEPPVELGPAPLVPEVPVEPVLPVPDVLPPLAPPEEPGVIGLVVVPVPDVPPGLGVIELPLPPLCAQAEPASKSVTAAAVSIRYILILPTPSIEVRWKRAARIARSALTTASKRGARVLLPCSRKDTRRPRGAG